MLLKPITRQQILDWSKLKQSTDDNLKFDENSRNFFKWIANTVGKGEIALYQQFLLLPQRFQQACFPGASKGVIVREWVNLSIFHCYPTMSSHPMVLLLIGKKLMDERSSQDQ